LTTESGLEGGICIVAVAGVELFIVVEDFAVAGGCNEGEGLGV